MKKANNPLQDEETLPEYDFSGKQGVRGKYAKWMRDGFSVRVFREDGSVTVQRFIPEERAIFLDSDVKAHFPDSESVNQALRSLLQLKQAKKTRKKRESVKSASAYGRGAKKIRRS